MCMSTCALCVGVPWRRMGSPGAGLQLSWYSACLACLRLWASPVRYKPGVVTHPYNSSSYQVVVVGSEVQGCP